jgi:hypothetical protein
MNELLPENACESFEEELPSQLYRPARPPCRSRFDVLPKCIGHVPRDKAYTVLY